MKKKYIWILSIALILLSSFTYVKLTEEQISDKEFFYQSGFTNVPKLKTAVGEAAQEKRFWKQKGYRFYTYNEMNEICNENGFIIGKPDQYIGEIPDSSMETARKNYEALSDYELKYQINQGFFNDEGKGVFCNNDLGFWLKNKFKSNSSDFQIITERLGFHVSDDALLEQNMGPEADRWELILNTDNAGMKIIAHHSQFVPGTTSDTSIIMKPFIPDPIIVLKQRKGYVVLAHWK